MRIEFELVDNQHIRIIGFDENMDKKEIGRIFSPSGSGEDCINCIRVCGFKDAFDLVGCGYYKIPITKLDDKKRVIMGLKGKKPQFVQTKDIQLLFDIETEKDLKSANLNNCISCYNEPCTCDNEEGNPYNLKREKDLPIIYKSEKPVFGDDYKTIEQFKNGNKKIRKRSSLDK